MVYEYDARPVLVNDTGDKVGPLRGRRSPSILRGSPSRCSSTSLPDDDDEAEASEEEPLTEAAVTTGVCRRRGKLLPRDVKALVTTASESSDSPTTAGAPAKRTGNVRVGMAWPGTSAAAFKITVPGLSSLKGTIRSRSGHCQDLCTSLNTAHRVGVAAGRGMDSVVSSPGALASGNARTK